MNGRTPERYLRKQLERSLSQQLQTLYLKLLGRMVGKVSCHLSGSNLTILIDEALTQPEQILLEVREEFQLVAQVRSNLDEIMRPEVIGLIEKTLNRKVMDFMSNTVLETQRTGVIVILSDEQI